MTAGSSDHRKGGPEPFIAGRQPVLEALASGVPIDKILLQAGISGDIISRIRQLAAANRVPVQVVPAEKFNSYTRSNHQGCIALSAVVRYSELKEVIGELNASGEVPLFIMLDGITDVRNIGGIVRTAVCCGAQAIVLPDKGVGALNEEAVKASAGALEKIRVCRVGSLLKAIDELHHYGIKVLVSEMKGERALGEVDFREACCIVLGSEGRGVQPYLSKAADLRFGIPMKGEFDSFNVSVAAGIILYEVMKQRFPLLQ